MLRNSRVSIADSTPTNKADFVANCARAHHVDDQRRTSLNVLPDAVIYRGVEDEQQKHGIDE